MNKLKLNIIETLLQFLVAVITLVLLFPKMGEYLPLIAIPFLIIITMRGVFGMLEENKNDRR